MVLVLWGPSWRCSILLLLNVAHMCYDRTIMQEEMHSSLPHQKARILLAYTTSFLSLQFCSRVCWIPADPRRPESIIFMNNVWLKNFNSCYAATSLPLSHTKWLYNIIIEHDSYYGTAIIMYSTNSCFMMFISNILLTRFFISLVHGHFPVIFPNCPNDFYVLILHY